MNNFIYKNNKGFSTLFIVIILGTIALTISMTLATSGFWSIKGSQDSGDSNKAKALANACAELSLEIIRENNNYTGTNGTSIDGNNCTYTVINSGGSARSIDISASVKSIIRNINIETSTFNPLVVSSWQEN